MKKRLKSKRLIIIVGVVIFAAALIIGGMILFRNKSSEEPEFVYGDETLQITVIDELGEPVANLEVDLWTANNAEGAPSAGYLKTDAQGNAVFKVPAGNYLVGFNGVGFPDEYVFSGRKIDVPVDTGLNQKTIILEFK
jgi:protocatechuate 3,4-dioxygenase beta subunit